MKKIKRAVSKTLYPGEYFVTAKDEIILTILGSCISVCLYDEVNKISGINHFMLPESRRSGEISNSNQFYNDLYENPSLRYGSYSMELLINEMLKLGGQKKYMLAKVFGGGNVLSHKESFTRILSITISPGVLFKSSSSFAIGGSSI